MLKVIVTATVGLIVGVVGMIALIYWQGTTTSGASQVGVPTVGPASIASTGGSTSSFVQPTNSGKGGNAGAGKTLFAANGCASCHTFAPAGASGTVGPDLAKAYVSAKADHNVPLDAYLFQSIQDPNAYITQGYSANIMPSTTFSKSLSPAQIKDLVAFLASGQAGK